MSTRRQVKRSTRIPETQVIAEFGRIGGRTMGRLPLLRAADDDGEVR